MEMLSENQYIYESYDTHVQVDKEYADYEQSQADQPNKVSGRLKSHVSFWSRIGTPKFILEAITQHVCVSEAISELLELGSIEICSLQSLFINPLTVSKEFSEI